MKSLLILFAGALVSACVSALLAACMFWVARLAAGDPDAVLVAAMVAAGVAVICFVADLIAALAIHVIRRRIAIGMWSFPLLAGVIAMLIAMVIGMCIGVFAEEVVFLVTGLGTIGGLAFWPFWLRAEQLRQPRTRGFAK